MSFISRLAVIPLSFCIALAARQDATYVLIWHPRQDDQLSYKMRVEIDSTPEKFAFLVNVKSKVVKVKPNGDYDVETLISGGHVVHGSHDEPIPDENKPTVDTYNSRGQKIASSEDHDPSGESNPGFNALDAVTDQLSPKDSVSIGATWSAIIKANPTLKREAARVNYTLVSRIKEGAYQALRIDYKYRETEKDNPPTVEGYILVNQDDYSLVRFEGTLKGASFSDDPDFPKGDATISLIRD